MKTAFWISSVFVIYTYLGYVLWLWLHARIRPRLVRTGMYAGTASIVMVVRDEAGRVGAKLQNLLSLEKPGKEVEVIVISDGSSDATVEILQQFEARGLIKAMVHAEPRGKAACISDALATAKGEIVFFADVRQQIEPPALRFLAENFVDPEVGCVSGELMLGDPKSGEASRGMGLYWRIEKLVRQLESTSGSTIGATGAVYAVRRELAVAPPAGTILDDVFIPMHVARQGKRVVFDSRGTAWDVPDLGREREFERKVRTLSGNYQLLQLCPWLLTAQNPLRFEFVSHKLIRLLAPFALAVIFVSSLFLSGPLYRFALLVQILFYGSGLLALARLNPGPLARVADAAYTFVVLNMAAAVAFGNFITGRKAVWLR
jgi:biofilm PGA synthesis N-glycosyltransferase PgaC